MADIAFSDKAGSSNFTASGDKNNKIFSDLLLNRAELEAYLTSLRRQQYSATPPANPNTGDMWRCSTTGATYTAGVLYRYSGTAWAQEVAVALNVPNRNTVLQGNVDASGNPALFEAGTGLAVKLNATATPAIFAFMNGNSASTGAQDIIDGIAADNATFWSSLPTTSTVYLFIDRSSAGVLSGSYTTLAPVTQTFAPSHSAGLQWIDFNTGKVQSSDGSVWTQRNRVFVGTATTNGTGVTATTIKAYNDGAVSATQQAAIDAKVAQTITNGVTTSAPSQDAVFDALAGKLNTGGQIPFPATQNPSADPNTLDDYEEGTWTPAFSPATGAFNTCTYVVQMGKYQKVGNSVRVQGSIYTSTLNTSGASGTLIINGLPFVSATPGVISMSNVENWVTAPTCGLTNAGTISLMFGSSAAANRASYLQVSHLLNNVSAANIIYFSGSYQV